MIPAVVAKTLAKRYAQRIPKARIAACLAAATAVAIGAPIIAIIVLGGSQPPPETPNQTANTHGIPADAFAAYQDAATAWKVDWAILAGIGWEECRHGTYQAPGCNPPHTVNHAGARGPMQFLGSTWRSYADQHALDVSGPPIIDGLETQLGYATDGDNDGIADPWSWPDATHAAARYLVTHNIHANQRAALFAYNRSQAYVDAVLAAAHRYRDSGTCTATAGTGQVDLATVKGITVNAQIATRLRNLLAAAQADGLTLGGTGYRCPDQQIQLRKAHCGTSQYEIYDMPSSLCTPPTARPGSSMHEKGLAIDFTCNNTTIPNRASPCFIWLATNAANHGLYNLPSEPWHWSIDGS